MNDFTMYITFLLDTDRKCIVHRSQLEHKALSYFQVISYNPEKGV